MENDHNHHNQQKKNVFVDYQRLTMQQTIWLVPNHVRCDPRYQEDKQNQLDTCNSCIPDFDRRGRESQFVSG